MSYGAKPTGNAGSTSADMQMLQDKAYDFQCGREGLLNFRTAQLNICPLSGLKKTWHERRELDPHFHEKVFLGDAQRQKIQKDQRRDMVVVPHRNYLRLTPSFIVLRHEKTVPHYPPPGKYEHIHTTDGAHVFSKRVGPLTA